MSKTLQARLLAIPVLAAAAGAHATVDTAAIAAAGTDAGLIAGAIFAVMLAIWASKIAYRKFFGS